MMKRCATGDCITFAAGVIRCGYLMNGDKAMADKVRDAAGEGSILARVLQSDGWKGIFYARDVHRIVSSYPTKRPIDTKYVTGENIVGTIHGAIYNRELYGTKIVGSATSLSISWGRITKLVNTEKFAFLNSVNSYHTGLLSEGTLYHSPGLREDDDGIWAWVNYRQNTQTGYMMIPPDALGNLVEYQGKLDQLRRVYRGKTNVIYEEPKP
jgi:hypothetical protein